MLLNTCDNYQIVRTQIIAGTAGDGGDGLDGADGTNGANGANACGRNAGNGGGNGGNGGRGGSDTGCSPFGIGPCDGNNGSAGGNGGGAGGSGGGRGATCAAFGTFSGQHGGSGSNGIIGANGGNGTNGAAPTFLQYFTPGAQAGNGANGTIGGGGGGAGGGGAATATDGGGGGGGGGGGAGGEGGKGGHGGGGSFSIYITSNGTNGQIIDSDLFNSSAGIGGSGGIGGQGGIGGNGGTGGTSSTNPCSGCQNFNNGGGNGGRGGNGGIGGNAQAGISHVLYVDGTLPTITTNGTNQTVTQGANTPTPFDLAGQAVITMDDIACTETDMDFNAANAQNWTFGAGSNPSNLNGASVTTEYTTLGRKDVTYNAGGYTGFSNIVLDAQLLPTFVTSAPMVNGVRTVCAGEDIIFTATNSGLNYNFLWDLGGAATPNTYTGLTFQTIVANFNTPGIYTIQLQYETNCCGISLPGTMVIKVEETPTITMPSDQQFCLGAYGGVTLEVNGIPTNGTIQWSPSTGLSNSNTDSVIALPNTTTTYSAFVTDSSGLCTIDSQVTVTVIDLVPTPNTTPATCDILGSAEIVTTGGSGTYSYLWNNGETTSIINNLQPDSFFVVVTDDISGCMDSTSAIVNAGANTLVATATIINESCFDANVGEIEVITNGGTAPYTFTWSNGVVNTTNDNDLLDNLPPDDYTINISDANGCDFTVNATVLQADSFVLIQDTINPTTCLGVNDGFIRVRADGGVRPYTFSFTNNAPFVIDNDDVLATDLGPGIYTLIIEGADGCTDSLVFDYSVAPVPTNILDTTLCIGSSFDLLGNIITIQNDTSVMDTVYGIDGCATDINLIDITASGAPVVDVLATPDSIFENQSSVLSVTEGFNYNWEPENAQNDASITVTPPITTNYEVVVSNEFGCEETYTITVYVFERELDLKVPDAFSPNGDGINDVFQIVNKDYFEDIVMKVYNRWGELIHVGEGFNHGWDGTYKGQAQDIDTYVYYIEATSTFSGNRAKVSGTVTIIR